MGFSAAIGKTAELARRGLSLAVARPAMIVPRANYPERPHDAVVILQRGANASTDLYLRPRAAEGGAPLLVADLDDDPDAVLDAAVNPFVVVCRYANARWLDALERRRGDLARMAFFMDDDLPAVIGEKTLPRGARGKTAAHFGRHVGRLSGLCGEVWVSTAVLAARYPSARAQVLPPIPDFDPPAPAPSSERRVVYHGTDVHGPERRFVLEVAARLQRLAPDAVVEITGDDQLRREAGAHSNVEIVGQQPWPDYRRSQAGRTAAVSLAPLYASPVNDARAAVKAFDAARLGAAGVFAEAEPYRAFVRAGGDGVVAAMDAELWATTIARLLAQPERRQLLAENLRTRLTALRRLSRDLPPPPVSASER